MKRRRSSSVPLAQLQEQETPLPSYRRITDIEGKTTAHGVNVINATDLSKGIISLKRGNVFKKCPPKRVIQPTSQLQEIADPQIIFLLHKQWTLYAVTPLYKFSYECFQEYSRQLSLFIAVERGKRLIEGSESELGFKVKFSSVPALKTTEQEEVAVLIQIIERPQEATENDDGKVVWIGCLCCIGGDAILEAVVKSFTCLPLFLAHGAKGLTALVETWFQQTFDCCFSPLHITPVNLAWMTTMWAGCKTESCTVLTELTFTVPCIAFPLDISYAIHPDDAQTLRDSIQSTPGEIRQEEVELFMEQLYNHFYRHFKIYLSATKLVKISTPVASVHSAGKIKILRTPHLTGILSLLTELAISEIA